MRIFGAIIIFLFFCYILHSQNIIKEISTSISEVKLYYKGAQVTQKGVFNIKPGDHTLIIKDLPANLDEKTIQVKGKGDFIIQQVKYNPNYIFDTSNLPEFKMLKDSLEAAQNKLNYLNAQIKAYNDEYDILKSNKNIGGTQNGVNTAELQKAMDYFRNKLWEIQQKIIETEKQKDRWNEKYDKYQKQLNQYESAANYVKGELTIQISCSRETQGEIYITYYFPSAGWNPVYDIRLVDLSKPLKVHLKAETYQNSGKNWEKIKLNILTSNPRISQQKPELSSWYLYPYYPQKYSASRYSKNKYALQEAEAPAVMEQSPEIDATILTAEYEENTIINKFSLPGLVHLPSGKNTTSFLLQEQNIEASYVYYTVPKIREDAFLIAQIPAIQKNFTLKGVANLYQEDTYVGKSNIDPNQTSDTLLLSLGVDPDIIVKRTIIKDSTYTNLIGSNKKVSKLYKIEIRNTKKVPVQVCIEDQIPISTSKEIEIENVYYNNAILNPDTKIITWKLTIPPGTTQKVEFGFVVKYPKNMILQL